MRAEPWGLVRANHLRSVATPTDYCILGVGDMTKILYHDNNIHHDIDFSLLKRFLLY